VVVAGNEISIGCNSFFLDHGPALAIGPLPRGDAGIKGQVKFRFLVFPPPGACSGKVSFHPFDSGSPLRVWDPNQRYLTCPLFPVSQSRGVAYKDESLAYSVPRGFVINKSSTVNIQYCPFCGRRLSDLVNASVAEFAKLANAPRKFQTMADR